MEDNIVLLDKEDIKKMFGWRSTTSIYDAMRDYGFPKQIRLTPRTVRWDKQEVDEWVRKRQLENAD